MIILGTKTNSCMLTSNNFLKDHKLNKIVNFQSIYDKLKLS
jgi:hypothetical protein